MRLLYLSADPGVPVLGHKGASVHVRELCSALAQAGAEMHIASPRISPEGDVLGAPAELHHIVPVLPKSHDEATVIEVVRAQADAVTELAERLQADAVYERFSLFSVAGVQAAGALGIPHVLEVNAPLREEASRYRTLPHPELALTLEREVIAATGRLFVVSEPLAAAFARAGADPAKVEVCPNAVAAHRFPPARRARGRFVAGFAGSLKPWHGIDTVVEAVTRAPDVHLEVVGHGPLDDLLDTLPAGRVTRWGARPHVEVIALMAGWDVGLAPYAPAEDFWFSPLKVLEYMAAGTCPVVSDLGDAAELLGHGRRGVLVPAGDAGALAGALGALTRDRDHARRIGARARRWVTVNRSWSANARRALAALERRPAQSAA